MDNDNHSSNEEEGENKTFVTAKEQGAIDRLLLMDLLEEDENQVLLRKGVTTDVKEKQKTAMDRVLHVLKNTKDQQSYFTKQQVKKFITNTRAEINKKIGPLLTGNREKEPLSNIQARLKKLLDEDGQNPNFSLVPGAHEVGIKKRQKAISDVIKIGDEDSDADKNLWALNTNVACPTKKASTSSQLCPARGRKASHQKQKISLREGRKKEDVPSIPTLAAAALLPGPHGSTAASKVPPSAAKQADKLAPLLKSVAKVLSQQQGEDKGHLEPRKKTNGSSSCAAVTPSDILDQQQQLLEAEGVLNALRITNSTKEQRIIESKRQVVTRLSEMKEEFHKKRIAYIEERRRYWEEKRKYFKQKRQLLMKEHAVIAK